MFFPPVPVSSTSNPIVVQVASHRLTVDNGKVRLTLDENTGRYDIVWGRTASIKSACGEWRLDDGRFRASTDYANHRVSRSDIRLVHDHFGDGVQITERNRNPGRAELRDVFWVYKSRSEIFAQTEVVGGASTRSLVPLSTAIPVQFAANGKLQSLFVPYDNDGYTRYGSDGWKHAPGSYEVGAIYSCISGPALVAGSIDHDTWKSSVRFAPDAHGGCSALRVVAGVADSQTRDTQPPAMVSGRIVRSPRFVIGLYPNWHVGMQRFGELNALSKPPMRWAGGVPFGWSSWSAYKNHVNAQECRVATDFVHGQMPWLRSRGIAYVNLDSFWDNLKPSQIASFVRHVHSLGLKAGIYYTPFVGWGRLTDRVKGTRFTYRDIALKGPDGSPLPKLDGGYPLDPTHPGELARIDRQFDQFLKWGFDYVKLDFMTHGAVEGKHFNRKIQTGTQAYNFALRHIDDRLSTHRAGKPIFIDLSIAPLFPSGYAHARRVSCDIFANIGATEYLLNATTYGFWTNHTLYPYNDGDSSCVYQPLGEPPVSEAEARSRLTASVITGGMVIGGDDFMKPKPRERVLEIFGNRELLNLAREAPAFWTLNEATGSKASNAFYWHDSSNAYLAVFNFSKTPVTLAVMYPGSRPAGGWRDLWSGKRSDAGSSVSVTLAAYDCAVLKAALR